ncbi:hypothetical protein JCM5350_004547 [Sporobolomyces pararoseus]
MPRSNASDTSSNVGHAEEYSTPRIVPTLAWQACQNFLIPRVKSFFREQGEASPLVIGNAPMSLVSHIVANPECLRDGFLAWWWARAGPVVAGTIVANRGIDKRAEKHLERRAAYGEADTSLDDSELSIYDGPFAARSPAIEVQVSFSSTKLMENTKDRLLGKFPFQNGPSVLAWQLPALVVLATNDLVKPGMDENRHYLAATLAAAVRFWRLAQPVQHARRIDFLAASGALLGCEPSLLVPGFNRSVRTKLSLDQISVFEKDAVAKLQAPDWLLIAGACTEIVDFVSNAEHPSRLPPLTSTSTTSSKKRKRTSSSLSKSPFAPCARSKIQTFPLLVLH